MNFSLHFGELHSDNSINDKSNLFENYILKYYKVKRILISFNCFSEYSKFGIFFTPETAFGLVGMIIFFLCLFITT